MAENGPTQRYIDAIANIKEAAKWLVASLGAVLAVMLGGIQLNALGFAEPSVANLWPWGALAMTILAVVIALYLAVAVLVSEGVALSQLKDENNHTYDTARALINKEWSHLPSKTGSPFRDLVKDFEKLGKKIADGSSTDEEDKELVDTTEHVEVAVAIARWQEVLKRFKRLRNAMLALIPIVSIAAAIMAGAAKSEGEGGTQLDPPVVVALPASNDNLQLLAASGWPAACTAGRVLPVLIYKEYAPGVSLATTTQATPACPQRRVVVMERTRILKVL